MSRITLIPNLHIFLSKVLLWAKPSLTCFFLKPTYSPPPPYTHTLDTFISWKNIYHRFFQLVLLSWTSYPFSQPVIPFMFLRKQMLLSDLAVTWDWVNKSLCWLGMENPPIQQFLYVLNGFSHCLNSQILDEEMPQRQNIQLKRRAVFLTLVESIKLLHT